MKHNRQFTIAQICCIWFTVFSIGSACGELDPALDAVLNDVKQYAPIIWLATDERLYPMMPHAFAFDRLDNDDDGLVDLEDADEVSMADAKKGNMFSELIGTAQRRRLKKLSELVEGLRPEDLLPPPRVLYEKKLYENRRLKEKIWIYQYWFYYLFDEGTGAHPHDSEHAFVFVDESGEVRGVVGAGHTGASANNILVIGRKLRTDRRFPQSLPKHMPILVELGKHASAPDRSFNGKFDVGMDANLFYGDVWGSRDVATAFAVNRLKGIRSEYSFPRDETTMIFEKDWHQAWEYSHNKESQKLLFQIDFSVASFNKLQFSQVPDDFRRAFEEAGISLPSAIDLYVRKENPQKDEWEITDSVNNQTYTVKTDRREFSVYDGRSTADSRPKQYYEQLSPADKTLMSKYSQVHSKFGEGKEVYELFPVSYMRELYAQLKNPDTSKDQLAKWLDERQKYFWGEKGAKGGKVEISNEAFEKMKEWTEHEDSKRDPWLHEDYKNPNSVFKLWLFPRLTFGSSFIYESGDRMGRIGAQIAGVQPFPQSSMEFYASFKLNREDESDSTKLHDLGFTYNTFRGRHQGWYYGAAWGGIKGKDHLALTGGLVPISWDLKSLPLIGKYLFHARILARVGLRGEIHSIPKPWEIDPIKFQISLGFAGTIVPPSHPLKH